jgi:hypothetical protein
MIGSTPNVAGAAVGQDARACCRCAGRTSRGASARRPAPSSLRRSTRRSDPALSTTSHRPADPSPVAATSARNSPLPIPNSTLTSSPGASRHANFFDAPSKSFSRYSQWTVWPGENEPGPRGPAFRSIDLILVADHTCARAIKRLRSVRAAAPAGISIIASTVAVAVRTVFTPWLCSNPSTGHALCDLVLMEEAPCALRYLLCRSLPS